MVMQLENQIKKQIHFLKIIYTINFKLKMTVSEQAEKYKIAIGYFNDFQINNKSLQKYHCLLMKRSAVKC